MRIAIVIYRVSPRGGLEDHALRIAAGLAERGHEVVLHTTGLADVTGMEVVRLDRRRPPVTNHGRMLAFAADAERATRGRFDRVVGFQPMPDLDVLFIADHLRDRPDASTLRRILPRHRAFAKLEASCFGSGARTCVLGLSARQMEAFTRRYPESAPRIAVLPPSIAETRRVADPRTAQTRASTRSRLKVAADAPAWLWLGLQPQIKGLDRVVEALALVPEATLLVGGLAPPHPKLKDVLTLARRRGVAARIRWLGYLGQGEVAEHFAAADVLAHPARIDVTGAVILEALINGLPVVATDACGFAAHIAASGAGRVVSSEFDVYAFTEALVDVCGPANAALSRQGMAYGATADLYSGVSVACDLIEAASSPGAFATAVRTTGAQPGVVPAGGAVW